MGFPGRARILFYSRFLYRICDIICNHIARLAEAGRGLASPPSASRLARLDQERVRHQSRLEELGKAHMSACTDCAGRCCHGPRERDTFVDRMLRDPRTSHRGARGPDRPIGSARGRSCCPQLTPDGCKLPYDQRPIQCVTYFCRATVDRFSPQECADGAAALAGLMGIEVAVAAEAVAARLRRSPAHTAGQETPDS